MTKKIVPPSKNLILPFGTAPTVKPVELDDVEYQTAEEKAGQIPAPKGPKILCALVDAAEHFDSGLIKSSETKMVEEQTSPVLFVVALGDTAYKDEARFPTGAWCKEGDFILTRPYTGTRVKIHGKEFRIIFDDQVDAVIDDPRGVSRA